MEESEEQKADRIAGGVLMMFAHGLSPSTKEQLSDHDLLALHGFVMSAILGDTKEIEQYEETHRATDL